MRRRMYPFTSSFFGGFAALAACAPRSMADHRLWADFAAPIRRDHTRQVRAMSVVGRLVMASVLFAVRSIVIVEAFPGSQLLPEIDVVAIGKRLIELLLVGSMRPLDFAVELRST